ncbi:GntR family transcriptional regulator [Jiella sp. MQZ9-1]|uniref:GntR family transcriptional regulator n=1 Tax=Jiella flava TaxID=2816857 RepID=A0A939JWD7_9HYPH|nr:GntR family transcriptional regulator [Jiella flava]MBO0663409.1 GntR family transcriptional regulator [Jiella flava]MCD2471985.1 GntR family transcriptional regulator [Jiella flava]
MDSAIDTAPSTLKAGEPADRSLPAASSAGPAGGVKRKAGDIRDRLEQEIATGTHPAGERLDEQVIAARFGVSRTPVREAINQLVAGGLVERIPNRGAFVRAMGLAELVEMFEVMAELEAMAGRLAARRIDAAGAKRLETALVACEAAADREAHDAYYYENERFHEAIYDACGNAFLAGEARRLHLRLKAFRRLQLRFPHRMRQSLAEHRRIVAAIEAGDGPGAEAELKGHILVQGERFADLVATLKP